MAIFGERRTLAARRTRSKGYGMLAASSKSLMPQTRRPSTSRQVPKFSTWVSPTESDADASFNSGQIVAMRLAQRKHTLRGERRASLPHAFVLVREIGLDHPALRAEPAFKRGIVGEEGLAHAQAALPVAIALGGGNCTLPVTDGRPVCRFERFHRSRARRDANQDDHLKTPRLPDRRRVGYSPASSGVTVSAVWQIWGNR